MKKNEKIDLVVISEPDSDPRAIYITEKLNAELKRISGDSGAGNAGLGDFSGERACFLLLYYQGQIAGCGAFRPLDEFSAEIKRMFVSLPGAGLGRLLLQALESRARRAGFRAVRLETRRVNRAAAAFYLRNEYKIIDNYGIYRGRPEAVCFEKRISD